MDVEHSFRDSETETFEVNAKTQNLSIDAPTEIEDRIRRLNERLARYIPPHETWTPADGSPAATSFLKRAGERIPPAVAFAILAQR